MLVVWVCVCLCACACACVCMYKVYLTTDTWNPGLEITTFDAFSSIIPGPYPQNLEETPGILVRTLALVDQFGHQLSLEWL